MSTPTILAVRTALGTRLHRAGVNGLIGVTLVGALLLIILVGLVWMPYDPIAIDLAHPLSAPGPAHWFGTDEFGRDVLSRSMLGARISVLISLATVALAITLGTAGICGTNLRSGRSTISGNCISRTRLTGPFTR